MGAAVPSRTDSSAAELRLLAKPAEDARQARRLLSLAAVRDGMSRTAAAATGAMTGRRCGPAAPLQRAGPGGAHQCQSSRPSA